MKILFVMILAIATGYPGVSQKYFTKNAKINFDATSPSSPERV